MVKVIVATVVGVLAGPVFAQVATSPPQRDVNVTVPVYRVTVVGRTTAAISYRAHSGDTRIDLVGTALMPQARGTADVSSKKNSIEIDARIDKMRPPSQFGREYLTYVLWAITSEGRPANLGELPLRGDAARVRSTTELPAFALIVTAEPYFAVTQPSDVVVMENVVRGNTNGNVDTVQAHYELLQRGSYLRDQESTFTIGPLEPGTPLDLAEARNAIAIARIAGARQLAVDSYTKATRLLAAAERAYGQRKRSAEVTMPARQAAQTAEDARLIALQRQEEARQARDRVAAAQRERDALDRVQVEEHKRLEAEKAATVARAAAEEERVAHERARHEATQVQSDAANALAAAEAARQVADANAHEARMEALRAQAAVAVAEQEKKELRDRLREQLNAILETRETARGLIMNVPDVLFDTASARLTVVAREKLARVGGILAAQPDLHVAAEGHTDNVGSAEENQRLSERRAAAVLAYLVQQKIPLTAVDTAGFGETRPIASNATPAGRQQNRRVELVVSGASIGRASTSASTGSRQ
jgi:outer membrane protein OmpA-like peptidoglycan-associated protein